MALVTYILGNCPGCGGVNTFGNVDVRDDYVLQGCGRCRFLKKVLLPLIKKKILYLDQFFFSHAFRGGDARFEGAAQKIAELTDLQLLIAPYSTIHETETHQWERREELFKFIKRTAHGHDFSAEWRVEQSQLVKAFYSFLANEPPVYRIEEDDVFYENVHRWESYLWVDVGKYIGDIEKIRSLKKESVSGLVDLFDSWRVSRTTFDDDVLAEHEVKARGYVDAYIEYTARIAAGDTNALVDSPITSTYVQTLMRCQSRKIEFDERLRTCARFLMSEHFRQTPIQRISSRIFATLKAVVRAGNYTNKELALKKFSGFFYDVGHIATYGPYCDAFVVDAPMAELLSKATTNFENELSCKFFSIRNWEEFTSWLDGLKTDLSDEHKAGLLAAYPTSTMS